MWVRQPISLLESSGRIQSQVITLQHCHMEHLPLPTLEKSGQVGNYCMTTRKSTPHSFSSLSIYSWSTAISNIAAWRNHRPFVVCKPRYYSILSLAPLVHLTPLYGSTFPVLAPVIYYHSSFPCFMPRHKCSRVYGRGCRRCKVLERDRRNPSSRSSLRSSHHPLLLPSSFALFVVLDT